MNHRLAALVVLFALAAPLSAQGPLGRATAGPVTVTVACALCGFVTTMAGVKSMSTWIQMLPLPR